MTSKARFVRLFSMAVLCLVPTVADAHPLYLTGEIGKSPVLAMLERTERDVSGWYLYLRYGKEIRLEGKIDAKGNFQFDESRDKDNKTTGSFKGSVHGLQWTGQWQNPAGGAALAFTLSENRDRLVALDGKYRCATKKTDRQFGYTYEHSVKLGVSKGAVKALDISRGETSTDGEEQSCSIALNDLKQIPSDVGILLRSRSDDPKAEDAQHCTVRIVGAGDYLYVQMGDSSETNNDCRSAADVMYCSPRSFWADMIVNRKTQVCKSVE